MKNKTLHALLKEFQDSWLKAEKELIKQKIEFIRMAEKNPKNIKGLIGYLETDIQKLYDDLEAKNKKLSDKRQKVMQDFPRDRTNEKKTESVPDNTPETEAEAEPTITA